MTSSEWIEKQKKLYAEIAQGKIIGVAAIETHRTMSNRIFNQGKAQIGAIGNYNRTKPIYISPKNSPIKFAGQGKKGTKSHKNGQGYKTKYFSSYAAFRSFVGRPTDKVNLVLSGNLQNDFTTGLIKLSNGEYISKLKRKENINKKNGMEKKFNKKIFSLSKTERELFIKIVNQETQKILNA